MTTNTTTTFEAFKKAVLSGKTGVPEWLAHVAQAQREHVATDEPIIATWRKKKALWNRVHEVVARANALITAGQPHSDGGTGIQQFPEKIREANEILNNLAAEFGVYARTLDNDSWDSALRYVDNPGNPPMSVGSRAESRTYRQVFNEIVEEAAQETYSSTQHEEYARLRQQREATETAA
jgi:predicted MPP superfamily phosphohydrolase